MLRGDMGRIIIGTLLTLLFLPTPYVTWYRVKRPNLAATRAIYLSQTATVAH
jgi:hypothetical protein